MAIYILSTNEKYVKYWIDSVQKAILIDTKKADVLGEKDILIIDEESYIKLRNETVKIILLSSEPNFEKCMLVMKKGIKAYGNVYMHTSHILSAIESIKENKIWIYPDFLALMMQFSNKTTNKVTEEKLQNLTPREKEIAKLIVEGLSNKEVAIKLGISVNTIKIHTKNIYVKLNVSDRLGLFSLLK